MIHWIGMSAATQAARNRKAKEIRLCRHYLSVAKKNGRTEKSTTVRSWRHTLAECRAMQTGQSMSVDEVIAI